jgi:hypothetical protein
MVTALEALRDRPVLGSFEARAAAATLEAGGSL